MLGIFGRFKYPTTQLLVSPSSECKSN